MDKLAAVTQANKILSFEARLSTCLGRESALSALWENTQEQLDAQKEVNRLDKYQIQNLKEQINIRSEEKEQIIKQAKKERFKSILIGGGIGIGIGAVFVSLLN